MPDPLEPDDFATIPIERQVRIIRDMAAAEERRLDRTIDQLPELVKHAVLEALKERPQMTEEGHEYLKIATKAAAQRVKLRAAIIEKSLSGLVWLAMTALGYAVWQTFVNIVKNAPTWIKP